MPPSAGGTARSSTCSSPAQLPPCPSAARAGPSSRRRRTRGCARRSRGGTAPGSRVPRRCTQSSSSRGCAPLPRAMRRVARRCLPAPCAERVGRPHVSTRAAARAARPAFGGRCCGLATAAVRCDARAAARSRRCAAVARVRRQQRRWLLSLLLTVLLLTVPVHSMAVVLLLLLLLGRASAARATQTAPTGSAVAFARRGARRRAARRRRASAETSIPRDLERACSRRALATTSHPAKLAGPGPARLRRSVFSRDAIGDRRLAGRRRRRSVSVRRAPPTR
mmetsp:Transcript_10590/g.34644  ORF Transcript_10590/g.34644 Transcript_10590/m.34644 type:complete len:280 (+) Transcript_10590:236-1075(+)